MSTINVSCPACSAKKGEPCTERGLTRHVHPERELRAGRLASERTLKPAARTGGNNPFTGPRGY